MCCTSYPPPPTFGCQALPNSENCSYACFPIYRLHATPATFSNVHDLHFYVSPRQHPISTRRVALWFVMVHPAASIDIIMEMCSSVLPPCNCSHVIGEHNPFGVLPTPSQILVSVSCSSHPRPSSISFSLHVCVLCVPCLSGEGPTGLVQWRRGSREAAAAVKENPAASSCTKFERKPIAEFLFNASQAGTQ